ncbi:hypothetical protein BW38_03967 [Stenotrophomonas sp. RIT309]|uniref:hypothetical protein n=1 Tax=Stenotrophomonas TaxID=40323 RepID=UPI00044CD9AF|nr:MULTISPECIES: hypothetical protein [Stenotrophomonas]EZP42687.1 hypothetical protein BW38_03967 [Stenotrophomonas sp. RIT309]WGV54762.1 hypothetical protein QIF44_00040 [Stenotrophomonas indicatrix]
MAATPTLAVAAALVLLLASGPATAAPDHRCLSDGRDNTIHLEWRWLDDGRADVRYAGHSERLPLRRVSEQTTVLDEDRPYQFDTVWEERVDGRINGHYTLSTQGTRIYSFSYVRARDGRRADFDEDVNAFQDDGCHW